MVGRIVSSGNWHTGSYWPQSGWNTFRRPSGKNIGADPFQPIFNIELSWFLCGLLVWLIVGCDRFVIIKDHIFSFILFKRYISFFVNFDFLIISCYDPLEGIVDLKRFFQFQSLLLFNCLQDYTDVDYNSKKILTIRSCDVLNHGFNFFKNIINDIIILLLIIHKFNHSNNRSLDDIFLFLRTSW